MSSIKWVLSSVAILYTVFLVFAAFFSYRLIFPYRASSYDESLSGLKMLTTESGQNIATRYFKAPQERYLALYFHGNGEDIGHLFELSLELRKNSISLLAIDYPDYGLSDGKPTEESCRESALVAYEEALNRGYSAENILIWGRSIGTGIAVDLAGLKESRALILDSPFKSAFTVATKVPILPFDRFKNLKKIRSIQTPLFIFHGEKDELIDPSHSAQLFEASNSGIKKRIIIPGAGHNMSWSQNTDLLFSELNAFLK